MIKNLILIYDKNAGKEKYRLTILMIFLAGIATISRSQRQSQVQLIACKSGVIRTLVFGRLI